MEIISSRVTDRYAPETRAGDGQVRGEGRPRRETGSQQRSPAPSGETGR